MIMGIDVGYSHTKVCTENGLDIFRSTVNEGAIDINVNSTKTSLHMSHKNPKARPTSTTKAPTKLTGSSHSHANPTKLPVTRQSPAAISTDTASKHPNNIFSSPYFPIFFIIPGKGEGNKRKISTKRNFS